MKYSLLVITLSTLLAVSSASAQTAPSPVPTPEQSATSLIGPVQNAKAEGEELLRLLEDEQKSASDSLAQLRQLYAEGLIARVELEESEHNLAAIQAKIEEIRNQIANSDRLAEIQKLENLAKTNPALIKPTLLPVNLKPLNLKKTSSVLRSQSTATWSIANLSSIRQFFSSTFGRALPTSAVGQSATHNRLGYDHRNAVDVALHPDSLEGRTLIGYLQAAGIPFLAFRSAIPGVATEGPTFTSAVHRTGSLKTGSGSMSAKETFRPFLMLCDLLHRQDHLASATHKWEFS